MKTGFCFIEQCLRHNMKEWEPRVLSTSALLHNASWTVVWLSNTEGVARGSKRTLSYFLFCFKPATASMYIRCFICCDSHVWQQNESSCWFLQSYKNTSLCFHFCQMRLIHRRAHYFLGWVFANISAHPNTHASTSDIRSSLLGKISERSTRVKDLPRDWSLDSRC